jgi:hypothetical protein
LKHQSAADERFHSTVESEAHCFLDGTDEEQTDILKALMGAVRHYFGDVSRLFSHVDDPRSPEKIIYSTAGLAFTAVLMFLFHLGSRRQIRLLMHTSASIRTFGNLFDVKSIPHGDTLNDAFVRMKPEQFQDVVHTMVGGLIRKKVLYPYRVLNKYFVIAGDGTGMLSFPRRHCSHCLTQTQNGKTTYYHKVFETKLVTHNGFAFSLMTDFIENAGRNPKKQDCELNAFYRLAPRLKRAFPRLPMLLSMDGLFACGPVFTICRINGWKFMVVLKDKDIPSINQEFEALWPFQGHDHLIWKKGKNREVEQRFRWVNGILYTDSEKREHTLSVIECLETKPNNQGVGQTTKFKWVTNFRVTQRNVVALANEGGRMRWKIENQGFKAQKTEGYELEHAYTNDPNAAKIFYYLLQIAHMIGQLLYQGSLIGRAGRRKLGSLKNFAFHLLEAWRNRSLTRAVLKDIAARRIQIRFCPDTS